MNKKTVPLFCLNPDQLSSLYWPKPSVLTSLAVLGLNLILLPAKATGFSDISTWSGATPCSETVVSSCVADPGEGHDYDIAGTSPGTGMYVITSQTSTVESNISFSYSFEATNTSLALAQYSTNGSVFTSLPPALNGSPGLIILASGQSFSFRLINSGEQPILGISNFSSTPVPAPLPFLGAAASFGWIRVRRAVLKARQQEQGN